MKQIVMLLLLFVTPAIYAGESVAITPISFQVSNVDNALSKFEQAIFYPEGMLKRYSPTGAKISNKRVSQNVINFVATKYFFFIPKSVYVNGVLDALEDNQVCSKDEYGCSMKMRFDSSDDLVTDNVEKLEAVICLKSPSETELVGVVRAKIILGSNYSSILGPMAIDLIKQQLAPLVSALTQEIKLAK